MGNMKMLSKTTTILLVILLLFSTSVYAYEITSFNTEIEVYNDGVAKVINHIILDTTDIKETFSVPVFSPDSVIVKDEDEELKFAILGTEIIIQPRMKMKDYKVNVQYLTNTLTSKNNDIWSITYSIPKYKDINVDKVYKAGLILSLPSTVTISKFSDDGFIFSENGKINIGWKFDLKSDEDTKIEVTYNNILNRGVDLIKIGFYSLLTIILFVVIFFCMKKGYFKITKRITKGKKDILKTLEDKEKEVIILLLGNKHQLYQSKIHKDTSISKATLSRIIKRLEERTLIEVRPSGNTNLILLQEWFIKK
jgi:hypothetical protein